MIAAAFRRFTNPNLKYAIYNRVDGLSNQYVSLTRALHLNSGTTTTFPPGLNFVGESFMVA